MRLFLLIFSFLVLSQGAWALNMETEDFAIQLPDGWSCDPDESVIVCTELNDERRKSAIVLINYKTAGPTDTLAEARSRLNKPKSTRVENGAPRLSRVVSFQDRSINGLTWIEALHFEGELPDYYTYYLATKKSGKFFLITLSAFKGAWDKYRPQFENIIASLRIVAPEPSDSSGAVPMAGMGGDQVPTPEMNEISSGKLPLAEGLSPAKLMLLGGVILLGLVALYAMRT